MGVPVIYFRSLSYVTDIKILAFYIFLFTLYYCITVLFIALSENKIMILYLS